MPQRDDPPRRTQPVVTSTPEQLFDRYRTAADAHALGELFDRTAPALLRVALHLTRDEQDAEDLVQETFLRAIEVAAHWDASRPVTPWLIGILGNRARDRARNRRRHAPDPRRITAAASPEDPAVVVEGRELTEAVERAVARLPEPYRPVLRLHLAYGHAPIEIAHALERPVGTVRSQLARGLDRLRRILPVGIGTAARAGTTRGLASAREAVLRAAVVQAAMPPAVTGVGTAGIGAAGVATLAGGALAMKTFLGIVTALAALAWWSFWPTPSLPEPSLPAATMRPEFETASSAAATTASGAAAAAPMLARRAPALTPAAPVSGSLRVTARWSTGGPAVGIPIFVLEYRRHVRSFARWRTVTDDRGEARFEGLPVGQVLVETARDEFDFRDPIDIESGREASCAVTLAGVSVAGIVVDTADRPVPGAAVVAMASQSHRSPQVLATTDGGGRFELRAMGATARIGARAAGFAPSPLQPLPDVEDGRLRPLRIVLEGAGGTLRCIVRGPGGEPVAPADVRVALRQRPGTEQRRVPAWVEGTDATGTAEFVSCPLGEIDVVAAAAGLAPWRGTVVVAAGSVAEIAIDLAPGATLEGVVRDPAGQPVAGYEVAVGRSDTTAYAEFGDFAFRYTRTDTDGHYRLDSLPAGEIVARGSRAGAATATQALHAAHGETVRWNPTVESGDRVVGRVVGPDGAGLKAIIEGGARGRRGWHVYAVSDDQGRFTLEHVDRSLPVQLDVRLQFFPARSFDGLLPERGELLLRVPAEGLRTVRLRGTVVDAVGHPVPLAEVGIQRRGSGGLPMFHTDEAGRFDLGPFPAGDYRAWITAKGLVKHETPWQDLAPESRHDFGVLTLRPAGELVVAIQSALDLPEQLYLEVLRDGGSVVGHVQIRNQRASLGHLAPGHYELRIRGDRIAASSHRVEVPVGERRLDIEVRPGAAIRIRLEPTPGAALPATARVKITDTSGALIFDGTRAIRADGTWPTGPFGLAAGAYSLQVSTDGRTIGSSAFTVPGSLDERDVRVPVR